jgi:trimeric autotransporter adhesin
MRHAYVWIGVFTIFALCSIGVTAQEPAANTGDQITIPRLIKFSGTLKDSTGKPLLGTIGVTFALYESQECREPLWRESQTVETDEQGRYGVYLGESEKEGLPLELFSSERARWLGIQVQGEEEQPRILFASVPYALKAKDADTVEGRPLSAFVLYEDLEKLAADSGILPIKTTGSTYLTSAAGKNGKQALIVTNEVAASNGALFNAIGGGGTANAIAKFTDADNIGASALSEVGGNIGVGTSTPYAKFTFVYDSSAVDPIAMLDTNAVSPKSWRFGGGVGTPGTFTIRDDTAGVNRFSIDSSGNIGVGTSTPYAKFTFVYDSSVVDPIAMLDTNAASPRSWRFGSGVGAAGTFTIRDDTAASNRFSINSTGNVGIGTTSPTSKLTVAGDIESSTGFTINGNSVFKTDGTANTLVGISAGSSNTTGQGNSFFGYQAGTSNTTGSGNSFFGSYAGALNTTGGGNSFFGTWAGSQTTAGDNSFFGHNAGNANTTGQDNSFYGKNSGYSNTTGSSNAFFGKLAGRSNTTANDNSFFGVSAGYSNTTGYSNSFFGSGAGLANTTGNENTASGKGALYSNTTGSNNTASGGYALYSNTGGNENTASGGYALYSNTGGNENTASGYSALSCNMYGNYNTASGYQALTSNLIGDANTACGNGALYANIDGNYNTASGLYALYLNTGGNLSTAVGFLAGFNAVGSNNIFINNEGAAVDSNTIRIGIVTPTTWYPNPHTKTFIAGIANATVSGSAVLIDSNGQLGIATSSRSFKEDIRDMDDASANLQRLRPVTFRYKPEYSQGATGLQYGLIAEEVAEVYPDLVQYDKDGKPFTVQYQVLSSMLLNEIQKQQKSMDQKDAEIAALKSHAELQQRQIDAMRQDSDARLSALERTMNRVMTEISENRERR